MGYYSSLIQRKFKDIVGKRYETVLKEYGEFLLTEEDMVAPEVHAILLPLDVFTGELPDDLIEVLSAYDARVSLAYITDARVYSILEQTLDRETVEEFRKKKEAHGEDILAKVSRQLEKRGIATQTRLFIGQKGDDVIRMAKDFDMLAISKHYGDGESPTASLSPLALRICQRVKNPAIIY